MKGSKAGWPRWTRFLVAIPLACLLIWGLVWMFSPRSFAFIERFGGTPIPFPILTDAETQRFRKQAELDSVSFGFTSDPKAIEAAMAEELAAAGWTRFEEGEGSIIFIRGEIRDATRKGVPVQELVTLTDSASFQSDLKSLQIPKGVTCTATLNRRTNLGELLQRLRQKPKQSDEE